RTSAQAAVARITGHPFAVLPPTPVQVLTAKAWAYHRARPELPEEPVILWTWDEARQAPVPRQVLPAEANTILGLKFAREALRLDPKAHSPRVAQLSLALEKAAGQASPDAVPAQDPATFAAATAAGPGVLGEVLNTALADGKNSLAGVAAL